MVIDKFKKTEILKKPGYVLPGSYSQDDFLEIYEKELKRSYRTNLPLTLVTINIESVSEIDLKHKDIIYHNLLNNCGQLVICLNIILLKIIILFLT